jgi:hypothetical protein
MNPYRNLGIWISRPAGLGQAGLELLSPEVTSSPMFVAGVTILGVAFLMSIANAGSSISRTFSSSSRKRKRRASRIRALEQELREARR